MNNRTTINLFSATSLSYLIVNQDISLIKISWSISFFYIAEYSTVWLSFNSFYLLPWPEDLGLSPGLCLSRRYPCTAVPGHPASVSPGGISTYWAVGLMGTSFKI